MSSEPAPAAGQEDDEPDEEARGSRARPGGEEHLSARARHEQRNEDERHLPQRESRVAGQGVAGLSLRHEREVEHGRQSPEEHSGDEDRCDPRARGERAQAVGEKRQEHGRCDAEREGRRTAGDESGEERPRPRVFVGRLGEQLHQRGACTDVGDERAQRHRRDERRGEPDLVWGEDARRRDPVEAAEAGVHDLGQHHVERVPLQRGGRPAATGLHGATVVMDGLTRHGAVFGGQDVGAPDVASVRERYGAFRPDR